MKLHEIKAKIVEESELIARYAIVYNYHKRALERVNKHDNKQEYDNLCKLKQKAYKSYLEYADSHNKHIEMLLNYKP